MSTNKMRSIFFSVVSMIMTSSVFAHPTGNMIAVGDNILWSYINPINDINHHACVMIWSKNSKPKVFIKSEYPGSDFMLYNDENDIYIIERKYLQTNEEFKIRILKTTVNEKPKVIWDWFEDKWRIGEGGFFMASDDQIIFGSYPTIYSLKKGKAPVEYFEFDESINRIRALANDKILLLGNNTCWLVEKNGIIIRRWINLLDNDVKNAPLDRNQIFDVDYNKGFLLLAYWGKRTFELIDKNGKRKIITQEKEPYTPHWVAFFGNDKLLFSSKLFFNGETPKPNLTRITSNGNNIKIW